MYPAILVLHRSRRIDGKLRLDSDDSREHGSFQPPESFQVSQLRLPLPCHSPVSKRRWHDADTLELERFADGPTCSGRIADPARLAPGCLPAHGRGERWSPRRLVSQPDWQLGRIMAQCAKSLQS